jgi:hypothetical protein
VQGLAGLENFLFRQLPARLNGVTFDHLSKHQSLIQAAFHEPAVRQQPFKTAHRLVDQEHDAGVMAK